MLTRTMGRWEVYETDSGLFPLAAVQTSNFDLGPTQLPIQWVPEAFSLGVKRPGHEADHSHH